MPADIPGQTTPVPLSNYEQVSQRITHLQQQLALQLPGYEKALQEIHTNLAKDEELAHLLTEEQVGIICQGLAKKKNIVIAEAAKKGGTVAGGSKRLKDVTLEDL